MTTGKKFRRAQQLVVSKPSCYDAQWFCHYFLLGLQPPTSGSCGIISEVHNWVFRHCKLSFSTWAGSTHTLKMMLMPRSQSLIVLVRFSELSASFQQVLADMDSVLQLGWWHIKPNQAPRDFWFSSTAMWDNQSTIPHPPWESPFRWYGY